MKIVFILLMLIAACSSYKRATEWLHIRKCQCGKPSGRAVSNSRLWGGGEAKEHYYTWMALVTVNLENGYQKICGGSLISDDTILTAAHCLQDELIHDGQWTLMRPNAECSSVHSYMNAFDFSDPGSIYQNCYTQSRSNYEVILGAHDSLIKEPEQKSFLVKEIIQHPKYDPNSVNLDYDYGIIKLYNPVTFNDYMSPVCLPTKDSNFNSNIKTYLTGWGDNPNESSKLQEIIYDAMSNEECAEKSDHTVYSFWDALKHWFSNTDYYKYMFKALTKRMTCEAVGQNKGTCPGDSGSPSVVRIGYNTYRLYFIQTGIHSKSMSKGKSVCNLKKCNCAAGVAAKVQTEIDWIESHITGKRCHEPPKYYGW